MTEHYKKRAVSILVSGIIALVLLSCTIGAGLVLLAHSEQESVSTAEDENQGLTSQNALS